MFRYIDNKNSTFLLGAYRGEKSQLEWILGEKPKRYEKLYNIRFNRDLFSQRRGGVIMKQTQESFEAMNLEYENLYNEDDERREDNSVWYS